MNSPFKEDENFADKSIPLRQYLRFGNILQAAFNYTTKNHKIRTKKYDCKCCICRSSFSPEDVEFIFVKNFVLNIRDQDKRENIKKIRNFLNSINKDSLAFFKRNSSELEQFASKINEKSDFLCLGKYFVFILFNAYINKSKGRVQRKKKQGQIPVRY